MKLCNLCLPNVMCSLTRHAPAEFLSFYGLLNFYLYTLAFVYSPSKNAMYGKYPCTNEHRVACYSGWFQSCNLMSKYWLGVFVPKLSSVLPDSQLKDNPAFSMLNDSDDEVIYG